MRWICGTITESAKTDRIRNKPVIIKLEEVFSIIKMGPGVLNISVGTMGLDIRDWKIIDDEDGKYNLLADLLQMSEEKNK